MLKGQDCVILIKLVAHLETVNWPQRKLASELKISLSEINAGLKRLNKAGLIRISTNSDEIHPILKAAEEYLLHGIKYNFPVTLSEYTRGIPTAIAAPIFEGMIAVGSDPLPVWPHAEGTSKGLALQPLYKSLPEALLQSPDPSFYELLVLVDTIRSGRARERNIASKLLTEKIQGDN